jgi:hypothetical protein
MAVTEDPKAPTSFSTGKFAAWFKNIDEDILKPFLIRKYDK